MGVSFVSESSKVCIQIIDMSITFYEDGLASFWTSLSLNSFDPWSTGSHFVMILICNFSRCFNTIFFMDLVSWMFDGCLLFLIN